MSANIVCGDNATLCPTEFLNSLNASGLPLAHLTLKPECPLMLQSNIDPTNEVFIPWITIDPSEDLPVNLFCHQFPVCLAFDMTIDKAQEQSIINVGIDLCSPVFSHGQLYVALSRCTSSNRIKVVFPEDSHTTHTSNIVYTEVLAGLINTN